MSQIVSEDAVGDQFLDVANALVARTLELFERQLRLAISVVELLGAAPRIPLRLEGGQHARDLVEVDTVGIAMIDTGIWRNIGERAWR